MFSSAAMLDFCEYHCCLSLSDGHLFCFSLAVFTLKKVDYIFRESYCVIAIEAPSLAKLNRHSKHKSDNSDLPPKVTKDKTLAHSFGLILVNDISESSQLPQANFMFKSRVESS